MATKLGHFPKTKPLCGLVACRHARGQGFAGGRGSGGGTGVSSRIPVGARAAETFVQHGSQIGKEGRVHDEEAWGFRRP